ncbi:hypothetical protein, partial [Nocardia sp. NPDC057030]|uniref:hypothetical protein n=1 Tax=Nocardia sp. NPDC057030 TaxID=3346005 RepID=UPI003632F24A
KSSNPLLALRLRRLWANPIPRRLVSVLRPPNPLPLLRRPLLLSARRLLPPPVLPHPTIPPGLQAAPRLGCLGGVRPPPLMRMVNLLSALALRRLPGPCCW